MEEPWKGEKKEGDGPCKFRIAFRARMGRSSSGGSDMLIEGLKIGHVQTHILEVVSGIDDVRYSLSPEN